MLKAHKLHRGIDTRPDDSALVPLKTMRINQIYMNYTSNSRTHCHLHIIRSGQEPTIYYSNFTENLWGDKKFQGSSTALANEEGDNFDEELLATKKKNMHPPDWYP